MSYAIIRNVKYKRGNLGLAYRHNERENKNYSNKDIDLERSYLNYHLKEPTQIRYCSISFTKLMLGGSSKYLNNSFPRLNDCFKPLTL